MLNPRSFADILSDLNDTADTAFTASGTANDYRSGWESSMEPFGIAQLMAELQTVTGTQPGHTFGTRARKAYPHTVRPVTPPPPRPPHTLNPEQAVAFTQLAQWAPQLAGNFDFRELKSAYRTAVLATHPDRGGTGESFQQVRKSYHILTALVKN